MKKSNPTFQKMMPAFFWLSLALVTTFLLIELPHSEGGFPHADKVVHAFLFFWLSIFGALSFPKQRPLTFICLALYGAVTEVLQHLLPVARYASLLDWAADIFGILLCFLIIRFFRPSTQPT